MWSRFLALVDRFAGRAGLWRLFWLVFLVALAARATYIFGTRTYLYIERPEVVKLGHILARTHALSDPYVIPSGPTALVPPVYPALLAVVYTAFPDERQAQVVQEFLCAVTSSTMYGLLPVLAHVAGLSVGMGLLAGLAGCVLPLKLWLETKGSGESAYAALMLVILCILLFRQWNRATGWRLKTAAGPGVLWGVALLAFPSFLPALVGVLFAGALAVTRDRRVSYWRFSGALLAVALLVTTPWTIRNYLRLGGFVWIRSNLGLELSIANSDGAQVSLAENFDAPGSRPAHPYMNMNEAQAVARMGELAYNRHKLAATLDWIQSNFVRFLGLTVRRVFHFWLPPGNHALKTIGISCVTLLGFIGLWSIRKTHWPAFLAICSIWLTYPLIYYFVQADPRYSYPLYWSLLLVGFQAFERAAREHARAAEGAAV